MALPAHASWYTRKVRTTANNIRRRSQSGIYFVAEGLLAPPSLPCNGPRRGTGSIELSGHRGARQRPHWPHKACLISLTSKGDLSSSLWTALQMVRKTDSSKCATADSERHSRLFYCGSADHQQFHHRANSWRWKRGAERLPLPMIRSLSVAGRSKSPTRSSNSATH
jgi:hypothetical protein